MPILHWNTAATGALLAAAVLALSSCREQGTQGTGCSQDSDCGSPASAFRCETQTGECYCRTNDACPPRQFCNTAGFCQDKSGCEKNEDCIGSNLFCDTTSGTCLSLGRCTTDLHCPLGQVCDVSKTLCVEGCRRDGDCPGVSCRCGDQPCACSGTTQDELQACAIGVCDPNFCSNDTFCQYGQVCGVPPDAGVPQNQCYSDYDPNRRPYCDFCDGQSSAGVPTCGKGANYCLVDTAHPGNYFCGADCSEGQACPRGYDCSDVIVVFTQWACTRANPSCQTNPALPCEEDADCPRGGVCGKAPGATTGFCAGRCSLDEGENNGFCTCLVDEDCAQETCSAGECSISRRPCAGDQDCRAVRCVDFAGAGGCLIGQNCAPGNGLTCIDVR